jgi:hypothetical protein
VNFLNTVFQQLGAGIQGEAQQAADAATQAFYVVAGELLIVIALLVAIFLVLVFAGGKSAA